MTRIITIFVLCLLSLSVLGQDTVKNESAKKSSHKVGYAAIPVVSSNRSRGFGLGVLGMAFFRIGDTSNRLSRVVGLGEYTTKKNWMALGFAQLSILDDKLRINGGGGYMNSNFQYYQDIAAETFVVPYNNYGAFGFVSILGNVYGHFYIGPSVQFAQSNLYVGDPIDSSNISYQNAIGFSVQYDNRADMYNPGSGINATIRYSYFGEWMLNDYNFNKLNLSVNYYRRLNAKMILASRATADVLLGKNVPFVQQSYVGGRDIRGYTKGEYRGDQVYTAQSELRWSFAERWGCVGFFGLAMAGQQDNWSPLLPGAGVGLRYKIIKSMNINLGGDAAVGKGDWGLYLRITEAF